MKAQIHDWQKGIDIFGSGISVWEDICFDTGRYEIKSGERVPIWFLLSLFAVLRFLVHLHDKGTFSSLQQLPVANIIISFCWCESPQKPVDVGEKEGLM